MIVRLSASKHSHDVAFPIDKRCNVHFSSSIEEFDHIIWWKGLLVREIFVCCETYTVRIKRNTARQLVRLFDDNFDRANAEMKANSCKLESEGRQQQGTKAGGNTAGGGKGSNGADDDGDDDNGVYYTTDTLLTLEQIEETKTTLLKHSRKKISNSELGMYILKLLYCYMLPRWLINLEDLPLLKALQQHLDKEYFIIQKDIMDNDCRILQTTNELSRKREILCSFSDADQNSFLAAVDYNLLSTLRSHFFNDISYMEEHYMLSQIQIKESKHKSEKRNTLYFEQMESQRIITRIQKWKNLLSKISHRLREQTKLNKRRSSKLDTNIQQLFDYSEIFQNVKDYKMKMKMDCFYKIKLVTIGELLKTSIYEVETFNESLGTSNKRNTISGFLVAYDLEGSSNWQTSEEKILFILTSNYKIQQKHSDFIAEINDKVSLFLSDKAIFRTSGTTQDASQGDSNSPEGLGYSENPSGSFGPREEINFPQPFNEEAEIIFMQLKERISDHVYRMYEELLACSEELEISEQKMVFVIYEDLLFNEIMENLYTLFKSACKSYSTCIWDKINTLPFSSLPICEVFTKVEKRKVKNRPECNRSTSIYNFKHSFPTLSFESAIKNKSISTLYKAADLDAECQMMANTTLDCSPSASKGNSGVSDKEASVSQEEFYEHFKPALMNIKEILKSPSILSKLHAIQLSVKCISKCVLDNQNRAATADDIITSLCGLLKCLSKDNFQMLCYQLALMDIFMPQAHRIGPYGNSLIHFNCSLQALFIESCNENRHRATF
ncbi:uncharacterized protein LOC115223291 [Argonauta hians]